MAVLRYVLVVVLLEAALLIATILSAGVPAHPPVVCGFVQGSAASAIACTDGTIFIINGGGVL